MFELIPSEYMRECYKELGFQFTDFQKATLIWNSFARKRQDILEALKELAEKTADTCIKKQILERLDYETKAFQKYIDNSSGKYIYVVEESEENKNVGFFADYNRALSYALEYMKKYNVTCSIQKQRIVASTEDEIVRNSLRGNPNMGIKTEEYSAYGGEAEAVVGLCIDGEVESFYSRELPEEEKIVDSYRIERFEYHFIKMPAPFQAGFPVRNVITGTYGILAQGEDDWNRYLNRIEERELYVDFSDIQLIVYELTESGTWSHEHVNPLYLEVENPPYISDDEKQNAFRRAMEAMSDYLSHNCESRWKEFVLKFSREFAQICHDNEWKRQFEEADKPEDIMN